METETSGLMLGALGLIESSQGNSGPANYDIYIDANCTHSYIENFRCVPDNGRINLNDSTAIIVGVSSATTVAFTAGLTKLTNNSLTVPGTITATTFSGSGASLTSIPQSGVTNLVSDLALKAPLASPTFTGAPAAPTAAQGTNTTQIATTAMVHSEVVLLAPKASPTFTGTVTTGVISASGSITSTGTIQGSQINSLGHEAFFGTGITDSTKTYWDIANYDSTNTVYLDAKSDGVSNVNIRIRPKGTGSLYLGNATNQPVGFYGVTPVAQASSTADLRTVLVNVGLVASGGATPLDLNGGAATVSLLTANGTSNIPVVVNGPAAGNAYIQFKQNGTSKGYIGWDASSNLAMVNAAGGAVIFSLSNTGTVTLADAANIVLNTTTGTKIGTATTQKLGFYNSTPVVQPNTTGTTTGFTAGGGSAVDSAATFTGNTGSTAYTIGDIVKALKTLGLLAG
jgi:hypothetical protein